MTIREQIPPVWLIIPQSLKLAGSADMLPAGMMLLNFDINETVFYLNRIRSDGALVSSKTFSCAKRKGLFMKGASDLRLVMT